MAGGFGHLTVLPCPPVVHGTVSAARAGLWKLVSGAWKGVLEIMRHWRGAAVGCEN